MLRFEHVWRVYTDHNNVRAHIIGLANMVARESASVVDGCSGSGTCTQLAP